MGISLRGAGGTPVDNFRAEVIPYKNPETTHRFRRRGENTSEHMQRLISLQEHYTIRTIKFFDKIPALTAVFRGHALRVRIELGSNCRSVYPRQTDFREADRPLRVAM